MPLSPLFLFQYKTIIKRSSRIHLLLILTGVCILLSGCGSTKSTWKATLSRNTIEAYEQFLHSEPDSPQADTAKAKLDTLYYNNAKQERTISSFNQYLRRFPDGIFSAEANQSLERLVFFKEIEGENTLVSYEEFLNRFPNGAFSAEAKSRIENLYFNQKVTNDNSIVSYEEYLKKYPDGKYSDSAKSKIEQLYFQQARDADSAGAYFDYLKRYPEGAFKAEALSRIEMASFRKANLTKTIDAYEQYIRQYPAGRFVFEANNRIAEMTEDYKKAKIVRVVVTPLLYQKKSDGSKEAITGVSLPVESIARRLVSEHTASSATGPETKKFDASLNITIEGIALGKTYGNDSMHYTGASLSGNISFEIEGSQPFKRKFEAIEEPPATREQAENFNGATTAPFGKTLKKKDSFVGKLLELLYKIYGPQVLTSAMRDADEDVRSSAAEVSGELKIEKAFQGVVNALRDNNFTVRRRASLALALYNDPRAVDPLVKNLQEVLDFDWIREQSNVARQTAAIALGNLGDAKAVKPLIGALKDPSPVVRTSASEALTKITSQKFGEDYDSWSKWFETQKK